MWREYANIRDWETSKKNTAWRFAGGEGQRTPLELKVLRTAVVSSMGPMSDLAQGEVGVTKEALLLRCSDSSVLKVR